MKLNELENDVLQERYTHKDLMRGNIGVGGDWEILYDLRINHDEREVVNMIEALHKSVATGDLGWLIGKQDQTLTEADIVALKSVFEGLMREVHRQNEADTSLTRKIYGGLVRKLASTTFFTAASLFGIGSTVVNVLAGMFPYVLLPIATSLYSINKLRISGAEVVAHWRSLMILKAIDNAGKKKPSTLKSIAEWARDVILGLSPDNLEIGITHYKEKMMLDIKNDFRKSLDRFPSHVEYVDEQGNKQKIKIEEIVGGF